MHNIFTYGSLMFEDVWRKVVRQEYEKVDGILYGFDRKAVRNEEYPALVKGIRDSSVNGIVYKDVGSKDVLRLDNFEGEYYKRVKGQVLLTDNQTLTVIFYVLKPEYTHILSDQNWDPERFKRVGIDKFLDQYCGFRQVSK